MEPDEGPGDASLAWLSAQPGNARAGREPAPDDGVAHINKPLGPDANWSSSFVWGQNRASGGNKTQSFLVESNYQHGRDTVYARFERVEKPGHELVLDEIDHERVFPINALAVGYVRDLSHGSGIDVGLGGQVTIHDVPDSLDRYYGDDVPFTFQVFLRVRPSLMREHGMHHSK